MAQALEGLELVADPRLVVGFEQADDAGVYLLADDLAIIHTVDFFTPVVDDPYEFGRIAAANALSDVYAMGGKPMAAMNIVGFPSGKMDLAVLREVLRGGLAVLREAGCALAGGHTVSDPELKYGLAVTGTVHPDRILRNRGARPGDALVLTKPLGTGIVNTALKRGLASPAAVEAIVRSMVTLNRRAAELLEGRAVHACTDVTGFGLLGHAAEMIEGSEVGFVIRAGAVPVFAEALEHATGGLVPGGLHRNRAYRQAMVDLEPSVPPALVEVLYDPQTSGGLLVALPEAEAGELVAAMRREGIEAAAVVGEVVAEPAGRILVRPGG